MSQLAEEESSALRVQLKMREQEVERLRRILEETEKREERRIKEMRSELDGLR